MASEFGEGGSIDRRALLGLATAGAAAAFALVRSRGRAFRAAPLRDAVSLRLQRAGEASCFLVGDIGEQTDAKRAVIARMTELAGGTQHSCAVLLGDNFYRHGVANTSDPLWDTGFERAFDAEQLAFPFFAALGNHDHLGNVQAQIDYRGASERWRMPARNYAFQRSIGGGDCIEFFVLDTQSILLGTSTEEQVAWLARELARSSARWKIVVGHHPIRSGGAHGPYATVAQAIEPILERGAVDLYASGHDHDLQLLRGGERWHQVVSGAGCTTRPTQYVAESRYAEALPGFVWLLASRDELVVQFIGADEGVRFAHTLSRA